MEEKKWKILILLLKQIAKEKKITQQQIADKTNLYRSHINAILNLRVTPRFDLFVKIAAAVGIIFTLKTEDGEKIDFKRLIRLAKANYK